jgi:hypothetical protein
MFYLILLIVILSILVPSLAFSTFNSLALSSSPDNSTVLQQAQKALEANQNQSSSIIGIQATKDSSQAASKITRGSDSMSTYENSDYGISIKFPNNWKPSEVNLDTYVIVLFSAPGTNPASTDTPLRLPDESMPCDLSCKSQICE